MFSARFGLCHFAKYIETTHLRDKIVDVILRFHFDFYFDFYFFFFWPPPRKISFLVFSPRMISFSLAFSQNDFLSRSWVFSHLFSQLGFFPSCSFEIDVHVFVVLS